MTNIDTHSQLASRQGLEMLKAQGGPRHDGRRLPGDKLANFANGHVFATLHRDLVERAGGVIGNVDVTLICEWPRVGPHRAAMIACLAEVLAIAPDRVNVKATTTERLGFTGRGEGIAAQAVATVRIG